MTGRTSDSGSATRRPRLFGRVYPILDAAVFGTEDPVPVLSGLAAAGVEMVQLRAKGLAAGPFLAWVRAAMRGAAAVGLRVIVNDRADVALLAGAAGAHLGQDDLSPARAREFLGKDAILGASTHNPRQVQEAAASPVDYLAIGPVFATTTKADAEPAVGLEGVRAARAGYRGPLVAIGGISAARIPEVLAAGAVAVAVIGALGREVSQVPERAARLLRRADPGAR